MSNKRLDYICEIGAKMIRNGGEISRAEDTIKRMMKASNYKAFEVFCLSSIVIAFGDNEFAIKRIYSQDLNLFEIDRANSISRAFCSGQEYISRRNHYSIFVKIASIFLATGSFCIYFGGSIIDAIVSGIIGNIISFLPMITPSIIPRTFGQSAIAGIGAFLFRESGIGCSPDYIMIGVIMLLIPGVTIGTAIRDIIYSDTISGISELTESLFIALAIALGFSLAVMIFG